MTGTLLRVDDLRIGYQTRRGQVEVVHGVSLEIPQGEIVALVGESGSGKSTLAQAIIRKLPEGGRITGGSVRFGDDDLTRIPERALRRIRGAQIGFVPQDPGASLNPLMHVGEQVAETLRQHRRLPRAKAAAEAIRILDEVGIPDPAARARQYPHELSGGLRQRVLIGIAWACEPRLVLADEPTSALDVTVQRHVLDKLDELVDTHGTSVLLVTHDLAVAADRADRIIVMNQGEIVEQGLSKDVLANPQHEYTRKLVAAAPGLRSARLTPRTAEATSESALIAQYRAESDRRGSSSSPNILEVRDLVKTYVVRGGVSARFTAADRVSFSVPRGSTFSIVGESGSGKTTSARIAARIIPADSGTVLFNGADITALKGEELRQLRRRIQVVYQNPFGSLDPRMSIERIIAEPLQAFSIGDRAQQRGLVRELLEQVRLKPEIAERRPAELSGGQRQRVAIARALAVAPELVVLDEPVSALDVSVQEQILQLLVDLQQQFGLSYLFISHDLGVVRQISDRVAVMQRGVVVESGETAVLFDSPKDPYTRELLAAIAGSGAA